MPWSPSDSRLIRDPRLDPYRGRVALLLRLGHLVGHVLVSAEYVADQTGGHAWWRRWSPFHEVAAVHLRYPDSDRTSPLWVDGSDLDAELSVWGRAQSDDRPEDLSLHWLAAEDSTTIASQVFGVTLDDHGQIRATSTPRDAESTHCA